MHFMSKSDLIREEKTIRKSKESCTFFTRMGQSLRQKQLLSTLKDLDMFITVQVLEDSPAVLSQGK